MKIRTTSRISLLTATAAILAIGAIPVAHAANTWDGGGADANWNTANNWDDNVVPASPQNLTFIGDTQTVTTNNITGFTAGTGAASSNGITFGNTGAVGTSAFTLSGTQITLVGGSGAGGSIISSNVTVGSITDTISLNMNLGSNNTTISTGTAHNLIISGALSQTTGLRALIKTGAGELFLQNAGNSNLGTTTINSGILTVNVAGGIQNSGTNSALGAGTAGANSQINFAGGTLNVTLGAGSTDRQVRIGSTTVGSAAGANITNNSANGGTPLTFSNAAFNVSAGAITAARTLTFGGTNTDANAISGAIIDNNTGGGGIVNVTKADAGRWILSGTNTYTGITAVNAGTLLINGNNSAAGGAVNVTGATSILGGNGTIGGAVSIGANSTLAPGNSPGLLTLNSTLTFSSANSKANFEIATGTRGTNYDAVNVAGLLTYNGDLTLTIGAAIVNGTYDLFGGAGGGALSQTGSFDTIAFAGGAYSGTWVNTLGVWTASSGGQDFTFTQSTGDLIVAVPEPGTWALLTTSLTGLLIFRRRRR